MPIIRISKFFSFQFSGLNYLYISVFLCLLFLLFFFSAISYPVLPSSPKIEQELLPVENELCFDVNSYYNSLGLSFMRDKNYEKAVKIYEKALVLCPSDPIVKMNIEIARMRFNQTKPPRQRLQDTTKHVEDPLGSEVHVLFGSKEPSTGSEVGDRKYEVRGMNVEVPLWSTFANEHQFADSGDIEQNNEIQNPYEREGTIDFIKESREHNNRGVSYIKQERFLEAVEELDKAIKLYPHDPISYKNMAVAMIKTKKINEALKYAKLYQLYEGENAEKLLELIEKME